MQVVVFGKQLKEKDLPYIQALFDALHAEGITTYVYTPYLQIIEKKKCASRGHTRRLMTIWISKCTALIV